jgi:hypothetical protein
MARKRKETPEEREQRLRWARERDEFLEYWGRRHAYLREQHERYERRRHRLRRLFPPLRLLDRV